MKTKKPTAVSLSALIAEAKGILNEWSADTGEAFVMRRAWRDVIRWLEAKGS